MHVYSVDVQLAGTLYIRAESEAEAQALYKRCVPGLVVVVDNDEDMSELAFSDLPLNHPGLPEMSLSPVMTYVGRNEPAWYQPPLQDHGEVPYIVRKENDGDDNDN